MRLSYISNSTINKNKLNINNNNNNNNNEQYNIINKNDDIYGVSSRLDFLFFIVYLPKGLFLSSCHKKRKIFR